MGNRQVAWLGNVLVFGAIAVLAAVEANDRDTYYRLVQEDGVLEWATVVLMLPAVWLCGQAIKRTRAAGGPLPWFFAGLLAFCVFFAGEEISWGQRLMVYQPPEYFLEHNSQQELNVHNLFKQYLRTKYLLMGILGLWGVLLPLLHTFVRPLRGLLDRMGVLLPPILLLPAFAATGMLVNVYPWKYTGEVAECLFSLLLYLTIAERADSVPGGAGGSLIKRVAITVAVASVLAALIPPFVDVAIRGSDTERVELAKTEAAALVADWHSQWEASGRQPSGCGAHIRVFTWVRKHDFDAFRTGEFSKLPIDETRREFFLDPWNNPYWIRHVCKKKRLRGVFLYSFGPDSHRDSSKKELLGDDVGVEFLPSR